MPRFHSELSSFSKWGQLCLFSTQDDSMGRRQMRNSRCFKPACGGRRSSTFWRITLPQKKIALESRTPHPYLIELGVKITWRRRISLSHTAEESMAFNQECCWNYGSEDRCILFEATLYSECIQYVHILHFWASIYTVIESNYITAWTYGVEDTALQKKKYIINRYVTLPRWSDDAFKDNLKKKEEEET